jgi:adenylate kinase family enzyme
MVCGPSNAGKSTLAVALASKLGCDAFHVDLFRHLPDTDWVQRSDADFVALHDAAILGDRWVTDGNYSQLMPQRMARATGIILLGDSRWANLRRYLWRTLFEKRARPGSLAGDKDSLKWEMIHWILVAQPPLREQNRARLQAARLPLVELDSMRALKALYASWELAPPSAADGRQSR